MNQQTRRSFALAAGVGIVAAVLTATDAGPAIAQSAKPLTALIVNDAARPVPVQTVGSTLTHVGRPVAEIVQLYWWATTDCFKRIDATGLAAPDCYAPPAGSRVVITDVQWVIGAGAGNLVQLYIFDQGIVFAGGAIGSANGFATLDHRSQTGFVFAPSLRVSPGGTVLLRGYIVPAE